MMKAFLLPVVSALAFSVFAAEEFTLLPDGDFEKGGKDWELPKPFWSVKKGAERPVLRLRSGNPRR